MKAYLNLLQKVLDEGAVKGNTLSLFGESLEFDLRDSFPLVTTRKINYTAAFAELECFINGFTDVREFQKRGVNFWNPDCYKKSWEETGMKNHDHDLGKIYGYQWRQGFNTDQLKTLIENLKRNPVSRRHILMTYNPGDIKEMCLPPCYVSHQFYVEQGQYLHLLVNQRSADLCLGVPFDVASFAMFLELMARETDLIPSKLKVVFGDVHIYKSHISEAIEQTMRDPIENRLKVCNYWDKDIFSFQAKYADIPNYECHKAINYKFEVQDV